MTQQSQVHRQAYQEIKLLVEQQKVWRDQCWNLIASENVASPAVEELLVSDLSHRYGDYEGIDLNARKYRGNRFVVQIEQRCQQLACSLFGAQHADLRPLSGHIAGIAPLLALCKPGDTVLELSQECGGHRLAGKMVNCPLMKLETQPIPFDEDSFNIDVQRTLELVDREKPRFVIVGSSLFLFPHPVTELRAGIDAIGSDTLLQYDGSHVLGLIAGKRFQQPLAEGADLITSSTHKTLGGPQGGLILTNSSGIAEAVGRALQPGLLSNHHLHRIPALCQTFLEWMEPGESIADRTVRCARALAEALSGRQIALIGAHLGYTGSHTVIIQAQHLGPAKQLAAELENANIIAGSCRLPGKLGPDGLRLGVQEMVRRGMLPEDTGEVAAVIASVLRREIPAETARRRVAAVASKIAERRISSEGQPA